MLVTTDMALPPKPVMVRMSACMPAPPVLSEPVMVSIGVVFMVVSAFGIGQCRAAVCCFPQTSEVGFKGLQGS